MAPLENGGGAAAPAVDERPAEPTRSKTVGEIVGELNKRKRGLKKMPSTIARLEENKKKRKEGLASGSNATAAEGAAETPTVETPAVPDPIPPREEPLPDSGGVVAPRVRIDENGNIVLDEQSLVVTAGASVPASGPRNVTTVEFGTKHVTSMSYKKREQSLKWSKEDTARFYDGLRKFGTDFSMMECLFDGMRTRRQIKLKFKREERSVPSQIDAALQHRVRLTEEDMRLVEQAGRAASEAAAADTNRVSVMSGGQLGKDGPSGNDVEQSKEPIGSGNASARLEVDADGQQDKAAGISQKEQEQPAEENPSEPTQSAAPQSNVAQQPTVSPANREPETGGPSNSELVDANPKRSSNQPTD